MSRSPEAIERNRVAARAYQARKRASMTSEEKAAVKTEKAAYYQANRERIRAQQAEAYKLRDRNQYAESDRDCHLRRKYGITAARVDEILVEQGGRCAICRTDEPAGSGQFCVDHDHETGAVRGLLCKNCNIMLGHGRDNAEVLMSAVAYLLQSQDVLTAVGGTP